jgi:hypothetical protein
MYLAIVVARSWLSGVGLSSTIVLIDGYICRTVDASYLFVVGCRVSVVECSLF